MRSIKFRAWDNVNNNLEQNIQQLDSLNEYLHKDKYNVMQFTSIIDKNNKEIYEGDVVTFKRSIGNWSGKFMTTTHKVIFTEEVCAFVMEYGSSYIKLRKHWGYEYEVIGNIYENPELLIKN